MGRPLRQACEEGWHHVYGRGIRKTNIFIDDADRLRYLSLLRSAFEAREVKLFAYCLLDNHYHLGMYDPNAEISEAMHQLGTNYARYFNDRYDFDGPLFRSRFRSEPVLDDAHLVGVSSYIHRNALDVDPLAPIQAYRWSSFGAYMGDATDITCLITEPLLTLAGGQSMYRGLVERSAPSGFATTGWSRAVDAIQIDDVEKEVRRVFGDTTSLQGGSGRGRTNEARRCAAALAVDLAGLSFAEAARRYDYRRESDCAAAVARFHTRARKNPDLAGRYERARTGLVLLGRSRAA